MPVAIKSADDIEKMRVAGRLASEVLDIVTEHVCPGVTTDELDRICNEHIVQRQHAIPANVGYRGFPKTVCTSVNQVVCHGIPGDKRLTDGDIVNIDIALIKDDFHGDTSRMYFATACRPASNGYAPAPILAISVMPSKRWPKAAATRWCANTAATASAVSTTTTPRFCTTENPIPVLN